MEEYKLTGIEESNNKSIYTMWVEGPSLIDYMSIVDLLEIFRKEGVDFVDSEVIDILEYAYKVTIIITDDKRLFARREF